MDERRFRVTRDLAVRYAAAMGDVNPLHHDVETAKRVVSLGRPNVGGALLATMALSMAEDEGVAFTEARFRYRRWCYVDETYEVRAIGDRRWQVEAADGRQVVLVSFR